MTIGRWAECGRRGSDGCAATAIAPVIAGRFGSLTVAEMTAAIASSKPMHDALQLDVDGAVDSDGHILGVGLPSHAAAIRLTTVIT